MKTLVHFLKSTTLAFALALTFNSVNVLAATFTVSNLNNSGAGSLRQAVADANATNGADAIAFQSGLTGTITLTTGQLVITDNLSIIGPGARFLTVSGNNSSRVFYTNGAAGTTINISGLTVTEGKVTTGYGGGIYNNFNNTLNLSEIAVSYCTAPYGGGIFNDGTLNLTRSTVGPFDTATTGGGGVYNEIGTMNVVASTVSDNTAGIGGGIANYANLSLENVTVSNNSSTGSRGGGILNGGGTTSLRNTIVAANFARSSGGDLNGSFNSQGNNLIGDNTNSNLPGSFPLGAAQANGDKIGNGSNPLDPGLGSLQDNGGQTDTLALTSQSPAIDAGNNCVAVPCFADPIFAFAPLSSTDQRGFPRMTEGNNPSDGVTAVDIGAYEFGSAPTAASVNVQGRITAGKRGVNSARVYLTDQSGATRTAVTNPLGYYRFEDVRAGETYVLNVFAKQFRFAPQVVTINQETTDLNFSGERFGDF